MILPDVNLLVYAYSEGAPLYERARQWWESELKRGTPVGLPWAVSLGFLRLMTGRGVREVPVPASRVVGVLRTWYALPNVQPLDPGPRHLDVLEQLLAAAGTAGRITTDAHLAALAIEQGCTLHSNDSDFARFPGLRWVNPLEDG